MAIAVAHSAAAGHGGQLPGERLGDLLATRPASARPAAAAQILAEAEAICTLIVWSPAAPMTVPLPNPFHAAAWG